MRRICLIALVLAGCGGSGSGTASNGGAGGVAAPADAATAATGGAAGASLGGSGGVGGAGGGQAGGSGGNVGPAPDASSGTGGSAQPSHDAAPVPPDTGIAYDRCAPIVRQSQQCGFLGANYVYMPFSKDGFECAICFPAGQDGNPDFNQKQAANCLISPAAGKVALCVMSCLECK